MNFHLHNKLVQAFIRNKKVEDADSTDEVLAAHSVISRRGYKRIRASEVQLGLLGSQPVELPPNVAARLGLESAYCNDDDS